MKLTCPKCHSQIPGAVVPISEAHFINNMVMKETFNATWNIMNKENIIRKIVGKINALQEPYKITVKVEDWVPKKKD